MGMKNIGQAKRLNPSPGKNGALEDYLPISLVQSFNRHRRSAWSMDIDRHFSASLFGLREASAKLNPAQKVRFVRYAQYRIRGAVLNLPHKTDWDSSLHSQDKLIVKEAIHNLSALLNRTPLEGELADELKISLDAHNKWMRDRNCLAFGEPCWKCGESFPSPSCFSCMLQDELLFKYLRVEVSERNPRDSDTRAQETSRRVDSVTQMSRKVQLAGLNLGQKLNACWFRFLIAVRFSKWLIRTPLPWNAGADNRFSEALAGLVEASASLESTQKLQFVSYAQFRIQQEILGRRN